MFSVRPAAIAAGTIPADYLLGYYTAANAITLALYAWDKIAAQRGGNRLQERTLQMAALAGGFLGAFLGQIILRHKTRHLSFTTMVWVAFLLHLAGWAIWLLR